MSLPVEPPWYATFFGSDYARFDDHPRTAQEVRFLEEVLPGDGAHVLDVGCGMGRHAIPLARKGYRVTGLDLSDVLLTRARRRKSAVRWVRADMSRIPLAGGSCDAVISMFSSLGYFEEESANYRVLSEIARVLHPGGRLVVEMVNRDFLIVHAPVQSWFAKGGLTVLEARKFDLLTGRSEVDVTVLEGGDRRVYHHSIRLYTATELATLLASVGIETLDVVGDFDAAPLTTEAPHMILVGERT